MGTRRSHGNLSLLLLLLFSILVSNGSSKGDKVALDMHCRSNDDDLGQRTLHQGEEWHWNFRIAFPSTHFWCDFRWYDDQDHRWYSGTFDVYRASIGKYNKYIDFCDSNCMWSARRDGIYLYRRDRREWQKRNEWHAE
ncbi:hypothetical protein MKX03_027913 [Papaver bracteatum]|nr:hypothetical protein MKX03_027913 [Papaver bracteatum]